MLSNMEEKRFNTLKKIFEVTSQLDKYVILCEDEQGRYIRYAFQDGEPHDNRCLSWYDKLQPNALVRNEHNVGEWASRLHKVGEIYRLVPMSCGDDEKEGDEHCSPGHPKKRCLERFAKHWTYDEPVKCACWLLEEVDFDNMKFVVKMNINQIEKLING